MSNKRKDLLVVCIAFPVGFLLSSLLPMPWGLVVAGISGFVIGSLVEENF